jgi:hypothetical protein
MQQTLYWIKIDTKVIPPQFTQKTGTTIQYLYMNKTVLIGTLCGIALIAVAGITLFNKGARAPIAAIPTQEKKVVTNTPVLVSEYTENTRTTGVYTLASDGTRTPLYPGADMNFPSFSSDGQIAYVSTVSDLQGQLVVAKAEGRTDPQAHSPILPAYLFGVSAWTKDNKTIIAEAYESPEPSDINIADSHIIALDLESGAQTYIDTGASPVVTGDSTIYYLKADGIYRTQKTGTTTYAASTNVFPLDVELDIDREARLALSADNTTLAVTHPNEAHIARLARSTEGTLTTVSMSTSTRAHSMAFAPASQDLLVLESAYTEDGTVTQTLKRYGTDVTTVVTGLPTGVRVVGVR